MVGKDIHYNLIVPNIILPMGQKLKDHVKEVLNLMVIKVKQGFGLIQIVIQKN